MQPCLLCVQGGVHAGWICLCPSEAGGRDCDAALACVRAAAAAARLAGGMGQGG